MTGRKKRGTPGTGHLYQPRYRLKDERGVPYGEYRHSRVWWWVLANGKRISTGCVNIKDAEAWRLQRLAEMGRGSLVGVRAEAIRYEEMERMLVAEYEAEGRKSLYYAKHRLLSLRNHFEGWRARAIDKIAIAEYVVKRRKEETAIATINLELRLLRRMFRLAVENRRLLAEDVPHFKIIPGSHVRRDFLEDADYQAVLDKLRSPYRAAIEFLGLCGWRTGEARQLTWDRVSWPRLELRLDTSKTGEPRTLSFGQYPQLKALLEGQEESRAALAARGRISPWVFHHAEDGRPINYNSLHNAWKLAVKRAGIVTAEPPMIHGLRRRVAKTLLDAGVSEWDAMSITGHRDHGVFRRYAIRTKMSQDAALAKLSAAWESQPAERKVVRIENDLTS